MKLMLYKYANQYRVLRTQYKYILCHRKRMSVIDLLVVFAMLAGFVFLTYFFFYSYFVQSTSIGKAYAAHKLIRKILAKKSCLTDMAVFPEKYSTSARHFNNL